MPSSAVLAAEGIKAVAGGKYQDGIDKLTKALNDHSAPLWLLERSKAYLRSNKIDLALRDAEKALQVSFERANRDHMAESQIRRAVALFRLGRYADADICAFWATRLLEGAEVGEDDGQQNKVDEVGDYTVRPEEVSLAEKGTHEQRFAALSLGGASSGRTKLLELQSQALSWRIQSLTQIEKLPAGHPGRKVNPMVKFPKASDLARDNIEDDTEAGSNDAGDNHEDDWSVLYKEYVACRTKNLIKTSFYQSNNTINADLFVKNVPADRFSATAEGQKLTLGPFPGIHPETAQLNLWGGIEPGRIEFKVKAMKVELVLVKEVAGKWPALQRNEAEGFTSLSGSTKVHPTFEEFKQRVRRLGYGNPKEADIDDCKANRDVWYGSLLKKFQAGLDDPEVSAAKGPDVPTGPAKTASQSTTAQPKSGLTQANGSSTPTVVEGGPAKAASPQSYPTSSKKAINWDKLKDVDDDEEEKNGDVNSFFKKLYLDADPDTKRAMMKSFIESNGTSLSTNWAEAQSKTYQSHPPEGVEAKKWD
ncbi:SGS-domain-containing protein [Rostrohypoxylon terebratum]|nr:SGS-domain-containing protein [Rostrohypoxylon terebratum]